MTQLTTPDRRVRLAADGVVANYIHDISARTAPSATAPVARRNGDRPARLAHTRAALRGVSSAGSRRR